MRHNIRWMMLGETTVEADNCVEALREFEVLDVPGVDDSVRLTVQGVEQVCNVPVGDRQKFLHPGQVTHDDKHPSARMLRCVNCWALRCEQCYPSGCWRCGSTVKLEEAEPSCY